MKDDTTMAELEAALRGWDLTLEHCNTTRPFREKVVWVTGWTATLRHANYPLVFVNVAATLTGAVAAVLAARDAS